MVDLRGTLLADVAVLRLGHGLRGTGLVPSPTVELASKPSGGNTLGVVKTGLARSVRMPVVGEHLLVALELLGPGPAPLGLGPLAALLDVGAEHVAGRGQEPGPLRFGQRFERRPVRDERLQQLGRSEQLLGQVLIGHVHI